jgi:nucleoside-diphosphate-sugar epimerase
MHKLIIGCGYLGLRVARAWLEAGDQVAALTRSHERAAQFQALGIEPVVGDVTAPESLLGLPEADTVLYAVGLDRTTGHSQRHVYVDGLRNILDALEGRVRRQFLYVSSTSVYGQTDGQWIDETSPCQPERANGVVCLDAENLVRERFSSTSHDDPPVACVLRLAGIYGPGRLIARVASIQSGEPLAGNPDAWLNLIHIDDAVRAVLACESRGRPGATYLVCDDEPPTRREYYETLARLVGAPRPTFTEATGEAANSLNKRCSNRRLREELQVELQYPTIAAGLPHAFCETR